MSTKRSGKKLRTALLAGTLAVAIALTGTFAWTSMTQRALNEAYTNKNPGGRLHDDFDGLNKDIYAENFTDELDGLPVFVRVRLSEYMETGTYAGRYRDGLDDFNNPIDRGVTILTKDRGDNTKDADINDTDTWPIHKPGATATAVDISAGDGQEAVHNTWTWDLGGSTIYMPTFNKNKDSLSADINGTYLGLDGLFNKDDPYSDYTEYKDGDTKTADAFYDIDELDDDEWNNGAGPGGPNGNGGIEGTDFERVNEIHTAKATRGATVLTMAEWEAKGSPIGDYWVWDTDGWAYWAAPLMPQEATGTLLTRIRKTLETDKCYYAINVEGQFATTDDVLDETKGFIAADNGDATPNAEALLEKIKNVMRGRDGSWYIDEGFNVYRQLDPVTGQTKALICAGTDYIPGTDDDTSGVIRTDDPVVVDSVDYGTFFLPPDTAKGYSYYRGVNLDGDKLLGTEDDTRLWYSGSGTFPDVTGGGALETKGADEVKVTSAGNATQVVAGHTLQFNAQVLKGGTLISDQKVTWTLTGNSSSNTNIDQNGLLTVADNESNTSTLTVKATAHVDDNQSGTAAVTVLDKNAYTVTVSSDHDTVKADKNNDVTETFTAQVLQALAPVTGGTIAWDVRAADGTTPLDEIAIDPSSGVLTVTGKTRSDDVKVIVTASYTPAGESTAAAAGTKEFTIQASEKPVVTILGADNVEAGSAAEKYTVKLDTDDTVTGVDWSIGSPASVTIAGDKNGATLTVPNDLPAGNTIVINATVTYGDGSQTVAGVKNNVKVAAPTGMSFTQKVEKLKKGENGTFTAQVNMNNATGKYASQEMDWSLEGSPTSGNTKLTGTGNTRTLTIGSDETAKELTVIAKSKVSASATVSQKVTVGGDGVDLGTVTEGSTSTVSIDGIEWYVLKIDGDKALILSKNIIAERVFDDSDPVCLWKDSSVRTYLNGTWLNSKATLKAFAQDTTINVRKKGNGTSTFDTTTDKVFLLSEADVFGTENNGKITSPDSRCYTADSKLTIPGGAIAKYKGNAAYWWLRSPGYVNSSYQTSPVLITSSGSFPARIYPDATNAEGIRPALWIQIQ